MIALALATVAAVVVFGGVAIAATRAAGDARARAEGLARDLDVARADATEQRERANALDAAIAECVHAGPVDGAFERLLQAASRHRATVLSDARTDRGATIALGPDDLLDPWQ